MSSKDIAYLCFLALVAFIISFLAGMRVGISRVPVEAQRDTIEVVRIDTLVVDRPVPVYRHVVDTMLLAVHDTTRVRDTLYMELPREQKEYRDTSYRAWVSGYRPALDSIRVYQMERIVTVTERVPVEVSRRWGIGVTAGYGITAGSDVRLAPFVGVGVSYNLVSW